MYICVEHQTYLGFSWRFNGLPRYFSSPVLPFGLSSACFCFTKLLRPLVKRWRSMSHSSFVYLDDGFGSQPDQCSAHWDPVQIGEWLGFMINTIAMPFQIPEAKVRKLKSLLSSAVRDTSFSYRELARIAGSLISVALAVGPLFTRQMYLAIESRSAWDHTLHFSSALLEKLRF